MRLLHVLLLSLLLATSAEAATNLQQVNTTSAQTIQNKQMDSTNTLTGVTVISPVFSGIITGNYSFGGNAILLNPTFNSPTFSGTAIGTYTLAGTVTITSPTINAPTITNPTITGGGTLGGTLAGTYTLAGTGTIASPILSGTATGTYTMGGTGTYTAPTINGPTFSGTAAGSLTNLALTTPALANGTVTADPSANLGISSKQYVDQHGFSTGDVKLTLKTTADTSWVLMNDTSIGDVSSGATGRANGDTSALYTLIWNNVTDTWAPVAGGRGASASADFSAQKAITLPKTLGRALAGYGTGTVVASGANADVDTAADTLTVASNTNKWITGMAVVFTLQSGTITGLTSSTTYYVIRNSATLIKLATTLANAQNGVAIDLTAKSSPVWTITNTFSARVLGEAVGEEAHAMSSTEQLAHSHNFTSGNTLNTAGSGAGEGYSTSAANMLRGSSTTSTGGNATLNIMAPTVFLNVMVKL